MSELIVPKSGMIPIAERIQMNLEIIRTKYRSLQQHSEHDTLLLSLPVQWTRLLGMKKADNVKLTLENDSRIVVERTTG